MAHFVLTIKPYDKCLQDYSIYIYYICVLFFPHYVLIKYLPRPSKPCGALPLTVGSRDINHEWSSRGSAGWQRCPALPQCFPQPLPPFSHLNLSQSDKSAPLPELFRVMDGPDARPKTRMPLKASCEETGESDQ